MKSAHVHTVGHLTVDDVVEFTGTTDFGALGGASVYSGLGAWMAGARASIISRIGTGYPDDCRTRLPMLDWSAVSRADGPSIHQWVLYESDGTREYILHPGSASIISMTPLAGSWDPPMDARVHLAPMPAPAQAEWVWDLSRAGASVTLDPHHDSCTTDPDLIFGLLPQLAAFLPSELESSRLTGLPPEASAVQFLERGAPLAVVKLGQDGVLVAEGASLHHVPAYPVQVVDVTGAGDAFCGAFAAALARGESAVSAACWGVAAASMTIQWKGATVEDAETAQVETRTRYESLCSKLGVPHQHDERKCAT